MDLFNHERRDDAAIDLDGRRRFLELDDADRDRLAQIAPELKRSAPAFVEQFYRHLLSFPETAAVLQDERLVERLKTMQRDHLESMLDAGWDDAYVARRGRVGDAHAQVGIKPHVFLGAYYQYLQFCCRTLSPGTDPTQKQFVEQMLSLLKVVLLDVGLTLDAYFLQATQDLRQALELVFASNAELRQFAQFTSHDLKTPLATVANLCDEVLDEFATSLPAEAKKLIEAARQRAFRMSTTIDELLRSTISIHSDAEPDEFPVGEAIAEAADRVRPQLLEKGIELSIAAGLPWVTADRPRVREAFYNLLANAAKFIDKRPGHIAVTAEIRGGTCILCFADNGPGIPREEWTKIFVPFRRLPMHHDVPGSGLGLYFTKGIVEQQGGRIWVESDVGKGSRFYVSLTLAGHADRRTA
ncbi:MAG: hypothetical protein HYX69_20015 [Planctomycetia bacterium]|nr:hypothetical protein [Planctomycetia bacterium]